MYNRLLCLWRRRRKKFTKNERKRSNFCVCVKEKSLFIAMLFSISFPHCCVVCFFFRGHIKIYPIVMLFSFLLHNLFASVVQSFIWSIDAQIRFPISSYHIKFFSYHWHTETTHSRSIYEHRLTAMRYIYSLNTWMPLNQSPCFTLFYFASMSSCFVSSLFGLLLFFFDISIVKFSITVTDRIRRKRNSVCLFSLGFFWM